MDPHRRFDQAYYDRFYENPDTQIYGAEEHEHLARYVFSFARWNGVEIGSVLDVGAGIGLWKRWIAENAPGVEYTGIEVSRVMCKKHGYDNHDIARWRDRKKYDLILCQGVLQYLPDPDVAPAVANIASMAGGLVYIEALTRSDLRERVDKNLTDTDVYIRNGSYYRGLFAKHLVAVGGGMHWTRDIAPPFWELDIAGKR